jgi:hypothetical protein
MADAIRVGLANGSLRTHERLVADCERMRSTYFGDARPVA